MRDFLRFFYLIHIFLKARLEILLIEKFKSRWIFILFAVSPWQIYSSNKALGERIRLALEEAGPIFIKFGQLLSTRPDIIPTDITKSLHKLRDDLPPFPTDLAKEIIEKELGEINGKIYLTFFINSSCFNMISLYQDFIIFNIDFFSSFGSLFISTSIESLVFGCAHLGATSCKGNKTKFL